MCLSFRLSFIFFLELAFLGYGQDFKKMLFLLYCCSFYSSLSPVKGHMTSLNTQLLDFYPKT